MFDEESDPKKSHRIDRHAVRECVCRNCQHRQQSKQICEACGSCMGAYFCGVCNHFDNKGNEKKIFHCDGCGICRVGGRENFFHCEKCCACLSLSMQNKHQCLDSALKQNCSVCLEPLFDSRNAAIKAPCGHMFHDKCHTDLVEQSDFPRCPLCLRDLVNLSKFYQQLREVREETTVPPELQNQTLKILCNNCGQQKVIPFHLNEFLACEECTATRGGVCFNVRKL
eukprot:c4749_g1_i1.p1 GENE.c4749_g1_i1~~c4749_g1_i1.p1  ORF type:complete len:263 (-),score=44.13 c4749_g1_i1:51-728(-)